MDGGRHRARLGSPAYDEIAYAGDADAIAWFFANVSGSPVVAEASIGPYRCNGSRISAATGLPTIIGWERHQQQQRYPETLPARVADVRSLYTSPDIDEKASILRRYNVEYVVVGDLERIYPIADNECTPSVPKPESKHSTRWSGLRSKSRMHRVARRSTECFPCARLTWHTERELGRSRRTLVSRPGGRHLGLISSRFLALPCASRARGDARAADRHPRRGLPRMVARIIPCRAVQRLRHDIDRDHRRRAGMGAYHPAATSDRAWLRSLMLVEVASLLFFAAYVWLRGYTPQILGTEKPMDVAFLASSMRAVSIPPPDPWFAGEPINYYYVGYLLYGAVGRLSGVAPEIGFNLALATVFSTTAVAAFGVAWNAIRPWLGPRLAVAGGLFAIFAVASSGNLYAPWRLIQDPSSTVSAWWWDGITGIGWRSSRIVCDGARVDNRCPFPATETINEFPFFSFLLGDLHPHLMALPFTSSRSGWPGTSP